MFACSTSVSLLSPPKSASVFVAVKFLSLICAASATSIEEVPVAESASAVKVVAAPAIILELLVVSASTLTVLTVLIVTVAALVTSPVKSIASAAVIVKVLLLVASLAK